MSLQIQELWKPIFIILILLLAVVFFMAICGSKLMSYDTQGDVVSVITVIVKTIVIPLTLSIVTSVVKDKHNASDDNNFGIIIIIFALLLAWLECWPIYKKKVEEKKFRKFTDKNDTKICINSDEVQVSIRDKDNCELSKKNYVNNEIRDSESNKKDTNKEQNSNNTNKEDKNNK